MSAPPAPPVRIKLRIASDAEAVRIGLQRLMSTPPICDLSDNLRGSAEIVLAEVLNNIVEHAYAQSAGHIDLTFDYDHPTLSFEVVDTGLAMPQDKLPSGVLAEFDDLPEGGFGWFLIRSLTRGLVYQRKSDCNTLSFWMEAN